MQKYKAEPELPAEVVYYNGWTDFESRKIRGLFQPIAPHKLAKLKPGSTVWIDSEKPSGKVYGYLRAEIVSIDDTPSRIGLEVKGPHIEGGVSVEKRGGWHKVHECIDPRKLARLVQESPLATETGTVSTISDASRVYLKRQGKVPVARFP